MKTLLVEDKTYIRKGLLNLLQLIDTEVQVVGECESVKEAVVVANACRPDLISILMISGLPFRLDEFD